MFATSEGTAQFKEASINGSNAHSSYFNEVLGLHFSSLGFGTYLGEPEASDDQKMEEVLKYLLRSKLVNVIDTAINYQFLFD